MRHFYANLPLALKLRIYRFEWLQRSNVRVVKLLSGPDLLLLP